MEKRATLQDVAQSLSDLSWQDMNAFAELVKFHALDDNDEPNDERYIASALVAWADAKKAA